MNKGFYRIVHLAYVSKYVKLVLTINPFSIFSQGSCIHFDKIKARTLGKIADGYEVNLFSTCDQSDNATIVRIWDHCHMNNIIFSHNASALPLVPMVNSGSTWILLDTLGQSQATGN
jgi:hypothetical protein